VPEVLIESARKKYEKNVDVLHFLDEFERSYSSEIRVLNERIRKTEDLAAVGLSVETSAHDIMLFMSKTLGQIDSMILEVTSDLEIDKEALIERLTSLRATFRLLKLN
jgi:hypothetical protein